MASAEEYANWIVANEGKNGTPEFATVAAAYKEAVAEESRPSKPTREVPVAERRNIRGELVAPSAGEKAFKTVADFATGASGLMRGGANLVSEGAGDVMWPKSTDSGAAKFAGEFADPLAWTIAGRIAKLAPYVPVLGKGVVEGGKALGRNAATGAATGGTIGALSDEGDAKTGATTGAVVNVALPPVVSGVARVARAVKQAAYPSPGNLGRRAAGPEAEKVIAALETQRSNVPGVNLTSGQAAVPANSAEFAALQKLIAEGKDPSRYFGPTGIEGEQQAARRSAVQDIGGTKQDLADAVKARSTASAQNYETAFGKAVKRDKELSELWKNPYFKDEVGEAWKLLRSKNLPLKDNLTEFLHFVKTGMDARLQAAANPNAPAISKATQTAIGDAKAKLLSWLEKNNPAYETARAEHASLSKPINQMKAGQELERALVAPGTEAERLGSFANAVRQQEEKISKASGNARIEDLTPAQRKVLDALEEDLKRNAEYAGLAAKGRTNLENRIGAPEVPPTGWFQPIVSAGRSWANRALGTGHENAIKRLAPIMADPQEMAKAMKAATPQQRAVMESLVSQYLTRASIIGGEAMQGER